MIGGIETLILRKARWYLSRGFKVVLLSSFRGRLHDAIANCGVIVKYVNLPMAFILNIYQFNRLVNWIIDYLNKHYLIVAHFEAYHPFTAILAEALGVHYGVPTVTGVFHPTYYFDEGVPEAVGEVIVNYDRRNALYHMNFDCWNSMAVHYGQNFKKTIIPLPIDAYEMLYKARNGRYKILSIGRLVNFKTYNLFMIDVIRELRNEIPNIEYTIIGDGPLADTVVNKIQHFKMGNYVKLIKSIEYDQIRTLINEYDLHIGMGTSILDVGKYGMPSLVAVPFIQDSITHGYVYHLRPYCLGELDSQDRPFSMLSAIRQFLLREDRQDVANRTLHYIQIHYNTDIVMSSFLDFVRNSYLPTQLTQIDFGEVRGLSAFEIARYFVGRTFPWTKRLKQTVELMFGDKQA